tara:strand:+ start:423 stop:761 length:339 start_codon:yes stop_codon:yes gene_type:complete
MERKDKHIEKFQKNFEKIDSFLKDKIELDTIILNRNLNFGWKNIHSDLVKQPPHILNMVLDGRDSPNWDLEYTFFDRLPPLTDIDYTEPIGILIDDLIEDVLINLFNNSTTI